MLQALEILCTDAELDAIDQWVEANETCTVDIDITKGKDGARNVVRLQSFWLSQMNNEIDADAKQARKDWAKLVQAFHAQFGY